MAVAIRDLLRNWVPVVAWMLLIFLASGDLMSAEHTSRFLIPLLRWIAPDISYATVVSIQFLVRKCAHLVEYAILAALLWRALPRSPRRFQRAVAIALVVAVVYACLDEFHQSFIPSRTGVPQDVVIDCCGALLGLLLCLSFGRPKREDHASPG